MHSGCYEQTFIHYVTDDATIWAVIREIEDLKSQPVVETRAKKDPVPGTCHADMIEDETHTCLVYYINHAFKRSLLSN